MAKTTFGVNHPLAVKVFSKLLNAEAYRRTFIKQFVGTGNDSLIQEHENLKKSAGDQITYGLEVQLQQDGVVGDSTLEGNEEALVHFDDSILVDQLRFGVRIKGKMTEQRVPYNLRMSARDRLADLWARRLDQVCANHLCGYAQETRTAYNGNNTILAPSTNRWLINGQSDEQSLTTGDEFTIDLVDKAKLVAETASIESSTGPIVRPISMDGKDYYVMFLHDYQVYDLRNGANSVWFATQQEALSGGDFDNPIFNGALGIWNNVILHKWSRLRTGVHSSTGVAQANTRRAVLCGAQALSIAFGGDGSASRYDWNEKTFDYANQLGVSAGLIYGMKKNKFIPEDNSSTNAEDFGTVVVSTYAASPV